VFCKHNDLTFIGNIHGDLINLVGLRRIFRSAYKCRKCGKTVFKEELNVDAFRDHAPTYNDYLSGNAY
jgi:hypothetical protein